MIAGFILKAPKKVLIRGIGPSLVGLSTTLQNPTLTLHDDKGIEIAGNNDWKTDDWHGGTKSQETAITLTSLAPTNGYESAILTNLDGGSYTVILKPTDSTQAGIGLVEVYDLGWP